MDLLGRHGTTSDSSQKCKTTTVWFMLPGTYRNMTFRTIVFISIWRNCLAKNNSIWRNSLTHGNELMLKKIHVIQG